jgi:hypothetical protein
MPRLKILSLTLFCLFVSCGRAALAANGDRDTRRAETVIAKLRLLDTAAASGDADAYRKLAGKLFPGLFVSVSELRDGDLKTDLSTAASFYELAIRARGRMTDCERELRETYFRLCRENTGDRAALLVAKARLHKRWAEAELSYASGARDAATLDTLAHIRSERGTDRALAGEALLALKELAENTGEASPDEQGLAYSTGRRLSSSERLLPPDESAKRLAEKFSEPLEEVDRILASLPRTSTYVILNNARDAFRDGLYWQLKTLPASALVVNANSLTTPDPLRQVDLGMDAAARAAADNLRAARKFIRRAEEELK